MGYVFVVISCYFFSPQSQKVGHSGLGSDWLRESPVYRRGLAAKETGTDRVTAV